MYFQFLYNPLQRLRNLTPAAFKIKIVKTSLYWNKETYEHRALCAFAWRYFDDHYWLFCIQDLIPIGSWNLVIPSNIKPVHTSLN